MKPVAAAVDLLETGVSLVDVALRAAEITT